VTRTFTLTIAYDGTAFAGWQRQASERTVQAVIEDALHPIEGGRAILIGAGRTDAGVHAAGQVASVRLTSTIGVDELQRALNATLPEDVRILAVDLADDGFNAQFAARRKTYRYWMLSAGVVSPQLRRYVWHVPHTLDAARIDAAAQALVGTHDFAAFQASGSDVVTTVREILAARMIEPADKKSAADPWPLDLPPRATGRVLGFELTGSGFLRHMVRNIVGTLVDIGRNRRPVEDIAAILASRDRSQASATAPAHGLVLWSVEFDSLL
jgi:tRNA pseudouridine38-40 synthase